GRAESSRRRAAPAPGPRPPRGRPARSVPSSASRAPSEPLQRVLRALLQRLVVGERPVVGERRAVRAPRRLPLALGHEHLADVELRPRPPACAGVARIGYGELVVPERLTPLLQKLVGP